MYCAEIHAAGTESIRCANSNKRSAAYMRDGEMIGPFVEPFASKSARHIECLLVRLDGIPRMEYIGEAMHIQPLWLQAASMRIMGTLALPVMTDAPAAQRSAVCCP